MAVPFPSTGILDPFTRANVDPLDGSWTSLLGNMRIVSNQISNSAVASTVYYYNALTTAADCECYMQITGVPPATGGTAVFGRLVNTGAIGTIDGYIVAVIKAAGTDTIRIQRIDDAVATTLGADISQEVSNGDWIGIRCIGTTIEAWYKASAGSWTLIGSRTDSTYSAGGRLGFSSISDTSNLYDNFGGGTYHAQIDLTASVTATGAILRTPNKLLSASVTAAGNALRTTTKLLAGSVTATTAITTAKAYFLSLTASVGATTQLLRTPKKLLSASVTPTTTIIRSINKLLTASVTAGTSILRTTNKLLSASVTATGSQIKTTAKLLSGSVAATAAIIRNPRKVLSSSVSATAAIIKNPKKVVSRSVSATATLAKTPTKVLNASVTAGTTLVRSTLKLLSGSVSPSGAIIKTTRKLLTASLSPAKSLSILTANFIQISRSVMATTSLLRGTRKVIVRSVPITATARKSVFKVLVAQVHTTASLLIGGMVVTTPIRRTFAILARIWRFVITRTRLFSITEDNMVNEITKRVDEKLDYLFDYSTWLQDGEIISDSTWEAPEDSELTVEAETAFDTTSATVWLSGGVASKARWEVVNTIETSQGRTAQTILIVNIRGV